MDEDERRKAASLWKHKVVRPRLWQLDRQWFDSQLNALHSQTTIPYQMLVPSFVAFPTGLLWAPWGPTTLRFFKAWCVCRVTGCIPLCLWECGGLVLDLEVCPLCAMRGADLLHIVTACPGTYQFLHQAPQGSAHGILQWVLVGSGDADLLHTKVS